jgi:cytochrome c-type biogenesis protein CcmF
LSVICAAILLGTLYPLLLESVNGAKISVGPPYFNLVCGLLVLPLLLALPLGPLLGWKRGDLVAAGQRLTWAVGATVVVMLLAAIWSERGPWYAVLGIGLGAWLIAGALSELALRIKLGSAPLAESQRRLINLPRSALGTTLAHAGAGMLLIGVLATGVWRSEAILVLKPGETTKIAGYDITFEAMKARPGPNYSEQYADFLVRSGGTVVTDLHPAKRTYPVEASSTTEAGIYSSWTGDLYTVIGDTQANGGVAVRLYFNPLVRFIWLGALVMFTGGALSLSDRRLRVGAPVRAKRLAASLQPAE